MVKTTEAACSLGHEAENCEFRSFLDRVADKWSLMLIVVLQDAPQQRLRFSQLQKAIPGISQRMLTTTLRHLERDGLLTRHFYPQIPPKVEYQLTALGKNLMVPITGLMEWIQANWKAISKARGAFDEGKKK
jgi:DNA-binding HxlR family transcriptional regulator